jgi:hypothetical protein
MLVVQIKRLIGFNITTRFVYCFLLACSLMLTANGLLIAQDNSPYSRYGIGDLSPNTNIFNRAMGGISAAYSEPPSDPTHDNNPANITIYPFINFNNPASYSRFYTRKEPRSGKLALGRILLDAGFNFDSRTLRQPDKTVKFTSNNIYVSYIQMGVPIKKNWGAVLGIRPISRIYYKIDNRERLFDPNTGLPIDSASTLFSGDGGTFLANLGTGYAIKNFSFGINAGYFFGNKSYSTRRTLLNDSVAYQRSNHQTKASIDGFYFDGGIQYHADLNRNKTKYLQFGVYGNLKQEFNSRSDIYRESFFTGSDGGSNQLDSVSVQRNINGTMVYPATVGTGIIYERLPDQKIPGLLLGLDFIFNGWDDYRYNGQKDSVRSNWQIRAGGQIRPVVKNGTFRELINYRAGFFYGKDYIYLDREIKEWGISAGMSLPVANLKDAQRRFRTQYAVVNLSFEYIQRGNKQNSLRENHFRISAGLSLSDLWFSKRKYN